MNKKKENDIVEKKKENKEKNNSFRYKQRYLNIKHTTEHRY